MLSVRSFILFAATLAIVATSVLVSAGDFNDPGIVNLTPDNFKKEVLRYKGPVLVAFTAPWCGHCKRLSPEYAAAAKALEGTGAKLANMDADKYGQFAKKFDVQGFPTIKFFKADKKKPSDYEGGRTKDDLVAESLKAIEEVALARLK